jgi:hypothetical protein
VTGVLVLCSLRAFSGPFSLWFGKSVSGGGTGDGGNWGRRKEGTNEESHDPTPGGEGREREDEFLPGASVVDSVWLKSE